MYYIGSKFRWRKDFKLIFDSVRTKDQHYVEPFCGSC